MKVILNEDVYNLGEEGDVCDVARGYARNYLFPKNLALSYTNENISIIENRRAKIEKRKEEKRQNALSLKEKLDGKEIFIKMNAGQSGKLFGSVTNTMIAEELQKEGIEVEKKKIDVASHSIKMIGTYPIRVKLYDNNEAELKLRVVSQSGATEPPPKEELPAEEQEAPAAEAVAEEAAAEEAVAEEAAAQEEEVAPETEESNLEESEADSSEAEEEK